MKERACVKCHLIVYGNICPNCKESSLSDDFTGVLIILDPEKSEIGKKMGITRAGRYALKVR
ncbi:transcription elongation factor subunit Spt4 [Candidatus Hecatella orcuttiae]|uniref:transcription elongation factor subunit Spt4 n=1 Tax=Candidatus Hecatella orcuttiae TaxID=1935119 RepID=UPI0028680194|nr:transcription elongation factor subunit Spt4 [Candidatus Hecatella orcuttiae]